MENSNIKTEIRKRTISYVLAAFGLVAGLAWNDAIKALIEYLFPLQQNSLAAKFLYAILITIIVVIVSIYMTKIFKRAEE